jgi:hypothetical protein
VWNAQYALVPIATHSGDAVSPFRRYAADGNFSTMSLPDLAIPERQADIVTSARDQRQEPCMYRSADHPA